MQNLIIVFLISALWGSPDSLSTIRQTFDKSDPKLISTMGRHASGAFFSRDNNGNDVLVWTEKLSGDQKTGSIVYFSIWDNNLNDFGHPIVVSNSAGCRGHDESMNKIAFKDDGTILCVYSKRTPTKDNKYAGALYYTQSFDGGKKWTESKYLHVGKTTLGLSRSFFDIARLDDGEIGAIWLDSRLTKKRGDGSTLFFAKTEGNKGFLSDKAIGTSTCECCRTELFVSDEGNIHAIYRDIWEENIRDISIITSTDHGLSFTKPKRISNDNWSINGCPHTGPSMDETHNTLHCIWFTMGGGQGIYYTSSTDYGKSFTKRQLLTNQGNHPQMIGTDNNQLVFVWDESPIPSSRHTSHGIKISSDHSSVNSSFSYIKAQVWEDGSPKREHWISNRSENAQFPVITYLGDHKMVIAWVQDTDEEKTGIFYKVINL